MSFRVIWSTMWQARFALSTISFWGRLRYKRTAEVSCKKKWGGLFFLDIWPQFKRLLELFVKQQEHGHICAKSENKCQIRDIDKQRIPSKVVNLKKTMNSWWMLMRKLNTFYHESIKNSFIVIFSIAYILMSYQWTHNEICPNSSWWIIMNFKTFKS